MVVIMATAVPGDQKPRSEIIRPEITRLPKLTWRRLLFRRLLIRLARVVVWIGTRTQAKGLENLPQQGPAVIVSNHLGDADVVVGLAFAASNVEVLAKSELYDFFLLGWLMDTYGVIWVHRGQPDKKALRAALQALAEGRMIAIAPEGRESLTGELEEGTGGAAYLALKSDAPVIPVTFTGSENRRVFWNIKHLRRTNITITVGAPFRLKQLRTLKESILFGTEAIMKILARQLPPSYRGAYAPLVED